MSNASQSSWKQLHNLPNCSLTLKKHVEVITAVSSIQILQSGSGKNVLLANGMYIMRWLAIPPNGPRP